MTLAETRDAPRRTTKKAAANTGLASPPLSVAFPTAPRIYNLFPLLAGRVSDWIAELPRIAAMGFDWIYVNPFHESGFSGSLYAIRDLDRLDPRFRDEGAKPTDDDAAIQAFVEAAAKNGLKVMVDLVINHTSKDSRLAETHPDVFARNMWGELESPYAVDPDDPSKRTVWGDLAELDYAKAGETLVPLFDAYIARIQKLGVTGFRCDAAYKVPASIWTQLIGRARGRDGRALFAAETLGCTIDETREVAGAGFDYLFNSFAWWDGHASWAIENYEKTRLLAPSIAFPENHDTDRLAATLGEGADVARALTLRYALASFFSSGVLMPMGYETAATKRLHVVETTPADRETTGIDISRAIKDINAAKAKLPAANVEGALARLSAQDADYLALLRLEGGHAEGAKSAVLILANTGDDPVSFGAAPILSRIGGTFGPLIDVTPDAVPLELDGRTTVRLAPGEFRLFEVKRAEVGTPLGHEPDGGGRVVIERVSPEIDGGRSAVKRVVGETIAVEADIFSDGHDKIAAAILYRPRGEAAWRQSPMRFVENDRWTGSFPLDKNGFYEWTIEGWRDPFASWHHEIDAKREAGVDVTLETIEGVQIAERAAINAAGSVEGDALKALIDRLHALPKGSGEQLDLIFAEHNRHLIEQHADRVNLSRYPVILGAVADRLAARFSAWYELFPRSMSHDEGRHGTFDDVVGMLPYVRDMGFDVLYFPPINPIGHTNRKGRNNALKAAPGDHGSVYAIGDETGGHDALHPDLGGIESFRRMVDAAHAHGLEIAFDFALQCSPDHPWIKGHPDWFEFRPDGTMKFAENPPKKYEDIYNVTFYGKSLPDLWLAMRDVVLFWCRERVRIFRVDNPHTKPLPFWRWLIAEVNAIYPDAIFLAEAFTRPAMMRALAKAGFQQSYTYFTWRDTKWELTEYMTELAGSEMGEYYRPNFFANTPDINPVYLQTSGRAGFVVRATLAATLSSAYGIYNGFELCEAALFRKEEYADSEKYQIRVWDYDRPGNIRDHITRLNAIRRENPALWDFRNITFLNAWNDNIIAYLRITPERDNALLILVNLDPRGRQECDYEVPLWEFGLPDHASIEVEDLLGGGRFTLNGKTHRIALDPAERSAVIWRLVPPARMAGSE